VRFNVSAAGAVVNLAHAPDRRDHLFTELKEARNAVSHNLGSGSRSNAITGVPQACACHHQAEWLLPGNRHQDATGSLVQISLAGRRLP
jgi:hypothetical protein